MTIDFDDFGIGRFRTLSPEEFAQVDICPQCKRSVKINRHNIDLCAEIMKQNKKTEKAAQNAIKKTNRLNKQQQL
jgi:hypothetical protein